MFRNHILNSDTEEKQKSIFLILTYHVYYISKYYPFIFSL